MGFTAYKMTAWGDPDYDIRLMREMRRHVGAFDAETLTYRWSHPDPRVDALQRDVMALVGTRLTADRRMLFDEIRALANDRAGLSCPAADSSPARARTTIPYLNEPWYC